MHTRHGASASNFTFNRHRLGGSLIRRTKRNLSMNKFDKEIHLPHLHFATSELLSHTHANDTAKFANISNLAIYSSSSPRRRLGQRTTTTMVLVVLRKTTPFRFICTGHNVNSQATHHQVSQEQGDCDVKTELYVCIF